MDIRDAFHNVDRRYTVSRIGKDGERDRKLHRLQCLGVQIAFQPGHAGKVRSTVGANPSLHGAKEPYPHVCIDDLLLCLVSYGEDAVRLLTLSLLCTRLSIWIPTEAHESGSWSKRHVDRRTTASG